MITILTDSFPNRTIKLCQVLHSWQRPERGYKNELIWGNYSQKFQGTPSIVRLKEFTPVEMTRELQNWHFQFFNGIKSGPPGGWEGFWKHGRAYGDYMGTAQGRIDYINNPDGQGEGLGLNPIVGTGAILEIIGSPTTIGKAPNGKTFGLGEPCWPIRTFNDANFDFSASPASHPYEMHRAVNARRDDGIEPFPQLGGVDVWVPIISHHSNVNWIPCSAVRVLQAGEVIQDPYW